MFTCSIISCSNDNSHFFSILFRVSEYWTPKSMQTARRSEKLEKWKNTPRCPLTTLTLLARYFSRSLQFALRNRGAVNRLTWKLLGFSMLHWNDSGYFCKKKKRKIYNRIPTSPLNRPPNLKLPIHLCFSMLLCRIDETERLHLRKTPKLKNYSLRQSAKGASPISRQSLL